MPEKCTPKVKVYSASVQNLRNGCRMYGTMCVPATMKEGDKLPAILIVPGAGCRARTGYYTEAEQSFVTLELGINYIPTVMDDERIYETLKQGSLLNYPSANVDDKENYYYKRVFVSCARAVDFLASLDFVDADRIGVMGGSQGGALSIVCASLQPKIKKAGVLYPYLCDYKRVWNLRLNPTAYTDLFDYFRMYDPAHEREDEVFELLGYIDIVNLAKRVKAEVFMATGLMDITCPPSTQFAMYNKLTCKKKYILYPEYGHEFIGDAYDRIFMFLTN